MKIIVKDNEDKVILSISSDGQARYKIRGKALRDNVKSYNTDDDLHVIGLLTWHINAYNSQEYLKRRLAER